MKNTIEKFEALKESFQKDMVSRDLARDKMSRYEREISRIKKEIEDGRKSELLFQEVARQTQSNIEHHIGNLVTLALKSVSPNFPNFVVNFVTRRKQLEADLLFERNGKLSSPIFSGGGGPKDIASFGLIIANWSIDKTRATIVLDEPFKQVSPDLQENVSKMLTMLSKELGLQFIIVSHAEDVNVAADKTFVVSMKNGVSTVKEQ